MRVGIGFTPFETRADVVVRLGVRADALGFAQVGVAEGWTHDATVLLTEPALRTSRIRLASAVLSVWGRSPRGRVREGRALLTEGESRAGRRTPTEVAMPAGAVG